MSAWLLAAKSSNIVAGVLVSCVVCWVQGRESGAGCALRVKSSKVVAGVWGWGVKACFWI